MADFCNSFNHPLTDPALESRANQWAQTIDDSWLDHSGNYRMAETASLLASQAMMNDVLSAPAEAQVPLLGRIENIMDQKYCAGGIGYPRIHSVVHGTKLVETDLLVPLLRSGATPIRLY